MYVVKKKRDIGIRIRAHRLERRLTQEQLAEMIDRSVETVSNLERGISIPNEATLRRLAQCLEVSVDELFAERATNETKRSVEYFRTAELLKLLEPKKLALAYKLLKVIAES
jgi:transcriptional regulator with XRE-family HTH domain